ncbi:unnamed protein product, partial [Ectocarpus fasciculatus]
HITPTSQQEGVLFGNNNKKTNILSKIGTTKHTPRAMSKFGRYVQYTARRRFGAVLRLENNRGKGQVVPSEGSRQTPGLRLEPEPTQGDGVGRTPFGESRHTLL